MMFVHLSDEALSALFSRPDEALLRDLQLAQQARDALARELVVAQQEIVRLRAEVAVALATAQPEPKRPPVKTLADVGLKLKLIEHPARENEGDLDVDPDVDLLQDGADARILAERIRKHFLMGTFWAAIECAIAPLASGEDYVVGLTSGGVRFYREADPRWAQGVKAALPAIYARAIVEAINADLPKGPAFRGG